MKNKLIALASASCLLLLAGCGSEPSEANMKEAIQKSPMKIAFSEKDLASIRKISCKNDGDKAYNCDIEVSGVAIPVRFVKGSDGWLAMKKE